MIEQEVVHGWFEVHGPVSAEEKQAYADRERESIAIYRLYGAAYYEDVYKLNLWMWEMVWEQAKEKLLKEHPEWARQWPELFREV